MVATRILGISAFYHDSAAALVVDGEIIVAAQEERFTRKKHDFDFPINAINYCLREGNVSSSELDIVVFYDKPLLKFERILETYLAYAPKGLKSFLKSMPIWLREKLFVRSKIRSELGFSGEILFCEHHESHAASAFYPSPFEDAAIVTLDGVGEWTTTSIGIGEGNKVHLIKELHFPHSLGLLYSAFTYFTGFKVNSGEYKMMGLAPYGEPRYVDIILKELVDLKEDGSFILNMEYFDYCVGLRMTSRKFEKLFGGLPRKPGSEITQREMDMASSIQAVTEEVMLRIARHAYSVTGRKSLCMAGGVALNCVGNGRILREGPFDGLWIQPAAGDAGGAIGAALLAWHEYLGKARVVSSQWDKQRGSLLGPAFSNEEIKEFLDRVGARYEFLERQELVKRTASLIAEGNVVGWFQGRMEFGPRALGSRSIVADPRLPEMQKTINMKVKFRESFRPFAPSVLQEYAGEYFDISSVSPYMLIVAPLSESQRVPDPEGDEGLAGLDKINVLRSTVPAVTHVDYSARIQTVSREDNELYYDLIEEFRALTGCPLVVNTSFNVRGEPIVCTPQDAYDCFMKSGMDYLVIGNFIVEKREQGEGRGANRSRGKVGN